MSKPQKSKQLCVGCRNNFYNTQGVAEGLSMECWYYPTAKVVTRYQLGWWTRPDTPGAFTKVTTLNCHSAPGQYAMYEKLPDFAVPKAKATP